HRGRDHDQQDDAHPMRPQAPCQGLKLDGLVLALALCTHRTLRIAITIVATLARAVRTSLACSQVVTSGFSGTHTRSPGSRARTLRASNVWPVTALVTRTLPCHARSVYPPAERM